VCLLNDLDFLLGPDSRDDRVPSCKKDVKNMSGDEAASTCKSEVSVC